MPYEMKCLPAVFQVLQLTEFSDGTCAILALLKVYKFRYIITVPF
jgi:hypothetical protein